MGNRLHLNATRKVAAGILIGYAVVSFCCFLGLDQMWASAAPGQPNAALGLIYRHNNHGSITYFSEFQATATWLMSYTAIPLGLLGALIVPVRWDAIATRLTLDDTRGLILRAIGASAVVTPFFVFLIGPYIVRGLNAAGFVMSLD